MKLLCDDIFEETNFLGQLILKTATDNNPSQINTEHEYMLCYCKKSSIQGNWKRTSQGAIKIINKYNELNDQKKKISEIQSELRKWIRENKDELKQVAHYNKVDKDGVYSSSSNSSNPHPGGYTYDIVHPKTRKPCPKPANGWRWPFDTFKKYDDEGQVEWGKDEHTQPHIKKRIETSTEYLRTLIYEDNRATTNALVDIFGGKKLFENSKPTNVLSRIVDFASSKSSIILDFFAGSGTTMHATMKLNDLDGGNRQCILVQLDENSICESVTYERNKRIIQGYANSKGGQITGLGNSLKYYRTAFVGTNASSQATDEDKTILAQKAGCLLALAENTLYEQRTTDNYQIFKDKNNDVWTAVYFKEDYRPMFFDEFVEAVKGLTGRKNVYIFSWGDVSSFKSYFDNDATVEIKGIPQPILDIYKSLNS